MYALRVFVTLEGPEGAGKSTVARVLAERLQESGHEPFLTQEPGAGEFGQSVRALLLAGGQLPVWSELFLFLADRAHHVESLVRPMLAVGKVVVCDRYADSTVVYQGHARGLPLDTLRELNSLATGNLVPDLTLLFDLEPSVGLARIASKDRLDQEPIEFHRRVRAGFIAEAAREPGRWLTLDASATLDSVVETAWSAVASRLGQVQTSC